LENVGKTRSSWFGLVLGVTNQATVSASNFLTFVILARCSSDDVFTSFALGWQVISYLRAIQERVISAPFVSFAHRPTTDLPSWTGNSLAHEFFFSVVSVTTMLAAAISLIVGGSNSEFGYSLLVQCMILPGILLKDHLRTVSFTTFHPILAIAVDGLASLLQLGGTLFLGMRFLWAREPIELLSVATVLAVSNSLPILIWFLNPPLSWKLERDRLWQQWTTSWEYAKWLVVARAFALGGAMLIPWILAAMRGDSETATFIKCLNLTGISLTLIAGLNNYLLGQNVHAYHTHGSHALSRSMWSSALIFTAVLAPLCLLFLMFGDTLVERIYKDTDARSNVVTGLLGLNMLVVSWAIVAGNGLAALGQSQANLRGELANCAVSLVVAVLTIPWLGMQGSALAILFGNSCSAVLTYFAFRKCIGQDSKSRSETRDVLEGIA
jgi:O-antigen/teichoic acid export membrane protein